VAPAAIGKTTEARRGLVYEVGNRVALIQTQFDYLNERVQILELLLPNTSLQRQKPAFWLLRFGFPIAIAMTDI